MQEENKENKRPMLFFKQKDIIFVSKSLFEHTVFLKFSYLLELGFKIPPHCSLLLSLSPTPTPPHTHTHTHTLSLHPRTIILVKEQQLLVGSYGPQVRRDKSFTGVANFSNFNHCLKPQNACQLGRFVRIGLSVNFP